VTESDELTAKFDLRNIKPCNSARIEGEDPLRVTTPSEQWAYAAVVPLNWENEEPIPDGFRLSVKVDALVETGMIGVAIAAPDLQSFVSSERSASATASNVTLDLKLDQLRAGLWLVIRNISHGGKASRVRLHRVAISLEPRTHESAPPSGDVSVFDAPDARSINEARMQNLDRLELALEGKTVLDVGCGPGHLSVFFAERGCRVVCLDARQENIERLRSLYPDREAVVANVQFDSLANLGVFDVVFCYGLLYHVEDPIAVLRNISSCCGELLLLETVISDHDKPTVQLVDEPVEISNQAAGGFGCRPSPSFITMALRRMGFPFIYTPVAKVSFPDFEFERKNDAEWRRDGHLLRQVFVASRQSLANPRLTLLSESSATQTVEALMHPANARSMQVLASDPDQIWIDVGAHLGEKTFATAEQSAGIRVFAFEPNLRVASKLMGRLANYIVLPVAIAEHDGSAAFYLNTFDAASSLLPFVPEGLEQWIGGDVLKVEAAVQVPTIRLDTFLNQAAIRRVAFLKVDAQGADLAVVRSAGERLRDIERISLEVQTTPVPLYRDASSREEILRFLTSAGFRLEDIETQSHGQEENLTFRRI
jgi:FkbM family methyltransferase